MKTGKSKSLSRKRYFYWKYRREHPERFLKKHREAVKAAEELGASKGMARFIAGSSMGQKSLFRIRYGYIDEEHLGDLSHSKVTGPIKDLAKAKSRYTAMAWLKDRDPKGRKFIIIEKSSDGGKTWPTQLFHDCQHF